MEGTKHATAPIITFLDSHVECMDGWLEPLLSEVAANRKAVVCPIIDVISDETFEFLTETLNFRLAHKNQSSSPQLLKV